jgi:hypothetical protein
MGPNNLVAGLCRTKFEGGENQRFRDDQALFVGQPRCKCVDADRERRVGLVN